MNRRIMLSAMAGGCAAAIMPRAEAAPAAKKRLGIAKFSFAVRHGAERAAGEPINFLEYCHGLGAGGIQVNLGIKEDAYIKELREKAESYGMFIEASSRLPRDKDDAGRFEKEVITAKNVGATVIRVAMGGRRYEVFDRAEQYREFDVRTRKELALGARAAAKHGLHLAIENHKDRRVPEMLDMLESIDSEYVGICMDTGNSAALLEHPMAVVEAFAPWARAVHVKDLAVCAYKDGFLLADVPLGQGLLDLPKMIQLLEEANPDIQFTLEMSTRDPLEVPCLQEKYWATMKDVPGADLARTLRYVRDNAVPEASLPHVGHLSKDEHIALEEANVKQCLAYAAEQLDL